jgi:hypothetical protein
MLRSARSLEEFVVDSPEGRVGKIEDTLFDDQSWTLRHFLVQSGPWLRERRLLISPYALFEVEPERKRIEITLSKSQIENSPDIDCEMPVSRQHEVELFKYYSWPFYWGGKGIWGEADFPRLYTEIGTTGAPTPQAQDLTPEGAEENPHLHSLKELLTYTIDSKEGSLGRARDLLFEDRSWAIRQLVTDSGALPTDAIEHVSWSEKSIRVRPDALTLLSRAG